MVIPAFNEEKLVSRCITSVLAAGLEASQVFVIDDCSTDATREVLKEFDGIHVVENPTRLGKVKGLQRAMDLHQIPETFEYIALLDADSHVDPNYFDGVVRAFQTDQDVVLVCGAPRSERGNWLTAYRALDYTAGGWIYREGQEALNVIPVAPGCASTYRSRIARLLDWDGGTLVEDMDLTVQVHRKRLGRVRYAPDAISHTQDPRRLRDYIGQITRWYSGTWQVMRLRGLPWGKQRIDVEFGILVGESLVYSTLILLLPIFAMLWPRMVLRWLLLDQLVMVAIAIVSAVKLRRIDVLGWYPTFALLRVINCFVWLKTFWVEIVRRRSLHTWFSPERYEQTTATRQALSSPKEAVCA